MSQSRLPNASDFCHLSSSQSQLVTRVCGTPGSIIHFYSKFVNIAFIATTSGITNLTSSTNSSSQFNTIQKQVTAACEGNSKRRKRFASSCSDASSTKSTLQRIFGANNIKTTMESQCGGPDLLKCNWIDQGMKVECPPSLLSSSLINIFAGFRTIVALDLFQLSN